MGGTVATTIFTPNGENLITTGGDAVRIWDVATGTELLVLSDGRVNIDLTRDGQWLYASSFGEGVVRVYSLLLEDAVALAHERLTRWWRPEECQRYLHTAECPPAPPKFSSND